MLTWFLPRLTGNRMVENNLSISESKSADKTAAEIATEAKVAP